MNIKVAIIDDEKLARDRIRKLLESDRDILLVGEARDAQQGLRIISEKKAELIFLDINMPGIDGFEMLQHIEPEERPFIIFSTAYPEYAVKAFDVLATDYLLKPFDEDRFYQALNRAKTRIAELKSAHLGRQLLGIAEDYKNKQTRGRISFTLKSKGRTTEIEADDIYWFESNGNYVNLNLHSSKHLHRITLKEVAGILESTDHFLQIHRSIILNLNFLEKSRYLQNNEFEFFMKNGAHLRSSKSFKNAIAQKLGNTE